MGKKGGFILPAVMLLFVLMMVIVPVMVKWVQDDTRISTKDQRSSIAFNLAEAAVERGYWKVKSSTAVWAGVAAGDSLSGYHFDTTYRDVYGGSYRISLSSGPYDEYVTIIGEGRDNSTKETRSVKAVYRNQTIYSPLLTGGNLLWKNSLKVFWGAVMSRGNITYDDAKLAAVYYPRKYAKGVVVGKGAYPRDTNGLALPNSDPDGEWESDYQYVPELPILDFAALRSSASTNGTLNVYGCKKSTFTVSWDTRSTCTGSTHSTHFGNPWNHPKSARYTTQDSVWFYDGNLTLIGDYCGSSPCGKSCGLRGTLIVLGDLTISTPGEYSYSGDVPSSAWEEHQKLTKTTWDSSSTGEYPGDIGYHKSTGTFAFGSDTWCDTSSSCGWITTVGMRGFTYVGGTLTINSYMDFNGAVWVQGDVIDGAGGAGYCGVFYNDKLRVPTLNVVLMRKSWQEIPPSTVPWL